MLTRSQDPVNTFITTTKNHRLKLLVHNFANTADQRQSAMIAHLPKPPFGDSHFNSNLIVAEIRTKKKYGNE